MKPSLIARDRSMGRVSGRRRPMDDQCVTRIVTSRLVVYVEWHNIIDLATYVIKVHLPFRTLLHKEL